MSRPTPLLRSINIQLDMEHPERIAHFWPTAKSVGLVSSIARARAGHALFVVAPYGSGKSIAASYAGHLVNNEPGSTEALRRVEHRLAHVDPELAQWVRERREGGPRGLFVPLYGKASSAARALQDGLASAFADGRRARPVRRVSVATARDVDHLLRVSAERARAWKRDRIVLVWDEFGRHLQGLVSEGRPEELDVLQVLAEVVSRPSAVPVTLVLLLHRSLLGYAAALPSGARKEWAKIEGRFETLQYVDDSAELYELVGSLVGDVREAEPGRIDFGARAVSAKRAGLFSHMDVDRLERCLARAWPLTATTLYLLPRVAARVAQSERSVFSFLQGLRLGETHRSGPVRPGAIYDYFGGDFRADGGPGGTHRPWLEAESARSKVPEGSQADEALKAAFLLSLGLAGERGRATRDQLLMALEEGGDDHSEGTLDELVQRNLLVHRRHSDQLVVWHGTDADVRGRLQEERKRGVADFELASFLATEFPPPVWRPVEYNARHAIRRYCVAEYMTVAGLERFLDALALHRGREPGTDGQMLYILPANPQEEARARELACGVSDDRLFLAVAPESSALTDAALDLWYLLRLQADSDLLSLDPLVGAELEHLADDARTGLGPMVDRVVRPQNEGSAWFYRGEEVGLQSAWALRRLLSEAMTKIFRSTPVIHSEMVVRRRVSPVVANARKKVALGILERCGQEDVGIEGNYADRAIFRSVFVRTGLYRRQGDTWALAQPEQIPGGGLREVWDRVRSFLTEPGRKDIQQLLVDLQEPPYGIRDGLLPLLLAAGFRAFPVAATLWRGNTFVDDLLPSVVEDMVRNPGGYRLEVRGAAPGDAAYLTALHRLFTGETLKDTGNLLTACIDAVRAWRDRLPPSAASSSLVSPEAKRFDRAIRTLDPGALLLEAVPALVGFAVAERGELIRAIRRIKGELDDVPRRLEARAADLLARTLTDRGVSAEGRGDSRDVRDHAKRWAVCIPEAVLTDLPDGVAKAVFGRLRAEHANDRVLVNALSMILVGLPVHEWDDAAAALFRRRLQRALSLIEDAGVEFLRKSGADELLKQGLGSLVEGRTRLLVTLLADVVGPDEAAAKLETIAAAIRSGHPTQRDAA